MGYDVRLAVAVDRLEKDLTTRVPYGCQMEDKVLEYWVGKSQDRKKIVVTVPDQSLTDKDMEVICALLHEHTYAERVCYTNERRFSLGREVTIKALPANY